MSIRRDLAHADSAPPVLFRDPRVPELYRWSRARVSARDFELRFLEPLRVLLQAESVALWFDPGGDALYLRHQRSFPAAELQHDRSAWLRHGRLLRAIADQPGPRVVEPGYANGGAENITGRELLIVGATVVGTQRVILEALRAADSTAPVANADLELLTSAAECGADYVRAERIVEERQAQGVRRLQQEFVQQLHASLDPQRVAFVAANDGARLLGCDRVTVLLNRRHKARVTAVSGQAEPNARANAVRLMESFATRVLTHRQAVVITANARTCPADLEDSLRAYIAAAGCQVLVAILLPSSDAEAAPLGVLLVEQFAEQRTSDSLIEGTQFVAAQTAAALRNATAYDQIAFREWRRSLGRLLAESVRVRSVLAVTAVLAVVVALSVVPWQLCMPARGTLRAAQRRAVFASEAGTVRVAAVRHGDQVTAGDTLVVLENHELAAQRQQVAEQLASVRDQRRIREVARSDRQLPKLGQIQLDGEIAELTERESYLRQQRALLERRISQLKLVAPMSGVVATWSPQQQLADRPVVAGDLLIELIDPDGPWQIELQIADVDAGYVRRAWAERDPEHQELPVTYIVATHPERQYHGRLVDMAERTETSGIEPVVYVTVATDPDDRPPLHDGADVRGSIDCGARPAGFVLLREVIEFVQSRVLF